MVGVFKKVFGTRNSRAVKRMAPRVEAIRSFEPALEKLSDDQLRGKTAEFKTRIENGESLDKLLHEAFAVVREASKRAVHMRHFDVQLIGGMVLHSGKIAEMRTGEGKTLVATLPAYLNALEGKGVHVVTVNDYLARRDAEWMGKIYRFLGMDVGVIVHGFDDEHKKQEYGKDITYGTNSEYGFDYLRDNMKYTLSDYAQQRGLNYAIIDEVDSILIDEARTPLIISGPAEHSADKYIEVNNIVNRLRIERDYTVDEKTRSSVLTDEGNDRVERMLNVGNLYTPANVEWLHHISKALQAVACYKRDVDYLVQNGEVLIIDEHTGRTMDGRRWSDGLHQAIEAKEGVAIQAENQTLATITYQNFYRMYDKLSGMTGTADTEAEEFNKIYELDVMVIPTNKPIAREDGQDLVYKSEAEKFNAVIDEIKERHENKQPILIGTASVEKSDVVSRLLKRNNIPHNVLNAKFHRSEAEIIAQAGQPSAVTISTSMAGRGTDIILGGNPEYLARRAVAHEELGEGRTPEREQQILAEYRWLSGSPDSIPVEMIVSDYSEKFFEKKVEERARDADGNAFEGMTVEDVQNLCASEAREHCERLIERYSSHLEEFEKSCGATKKNVLASGGLAVIATERHESRRIDNQLRGRAGRQGDPGMSRFYLSLEDDLMRLFGGDKLITMMDRLGMEDDVPIEAKMVSKSIEGAQKRVEGQNFDMRKNLIDYDDVMNTQRKTVYELRRKVLGDDPMDEDIMDIVERVLAQTIEATCPKFSAADEWNVDGLKTKVKGVFGVSIKPMIDSKKIFEMRPEDILDELFLMMEKRWHDKFKEFEERFAVVKDGLKPKDALEVTDKIVEPVSRFFIRNLYSREIDSFWREHLTHMDHLKEGIHLRGYGQRDPKIEYKREGFQLFEAMMSDIDHNVLTKLYNIELATRDEALQIEEQERKRRQAAEALQRAAQLAGSSGNKSSDGLGSDDGVARSAAPKKVRRPGRNDPCHCGSGKKYKKCHMREDEANEPPQVSA